MNNQNLWFSVGHSLVLPVFVRKIMGYRLRYRLCMARACVTGYQRGLLMALVERVPRARFFIRIFPLVLGLASMSPVFAQETGNPGDTGQRNKVEGRAQPEQLQAAPPSSPEIFEGIVIGMHRYRNVT